MKKFIYKLGVICFALAAIIACEDSENVDPNAPVQPTEQEMEAAFATYQSLDQLWDMASEEASKSYEDTNSVFNRSTLKSDSTCFEFNLLVETAQSPVPGFETYEAYTRIIINFDNPPCDQDTVILGGSIEIYLAGLLENRWKDSTVYNNLQFANGSVVDGFRTAALVPDQSSLGNSVFQINIDGSVTSADQNEYRWVSSVLENRSALLSQAGTLERSGSVTYTDVAQNYSINVTTSEGRQRKAACDPAYRYVVQGKETIQDNRFLNFQVDYGDGSCDNIATIVPAFGNPFEIVL